MLTITISILEKGFKESTVKNETHSQTVNTCCFSPDGAKILNDYGNVLTIRDAQTGHVAKTLVGHFDHINACSFSHSGKAIVSASADGTLRVWG